MLWWVETLVRGQFGHIHEQLLRAHEDWTFFRHVLRAHDVYIGKERRQRPARELANSAV